VSGLFLLIFTGGFLLAQQGPRITIVNNTGYHVYYLYIGICGGNDDDWSDDLLGRSTLPNGHSFVVELGYPLNVVNQYDIILVDLDGDYYSKCVRVSANAIITFTFNDIEDGNRSSASGGGRSSGSGSFTPSTPSFTPITPITPNYTPPRTTPPAPQQRFCNMCHNNNRAVTRGNGQCYMCNGTGRANACVRNPQGANCRDPNCAHRCRTCNGSGTCQTCRGSGVR
jgi:hypothetical protein